MSLLTEATELVKAIVFKNKDARPNAIRWLLRNPLNYNKSVPMSHRQAVQLVTETLIKKGDEMCCFCGERLSLYATKPYCEDGGSDAYSTQKACWRQQLRKASETYNPEFHRLSLREKLRGAFAWMKPRTGEHDVLVSILHYAEFDAFAYLSRDEEKAFTDLVAPVQGGFIRPLETPINIWDALKYWYAFEAFSQLNVVWEDLDAVNISLHVFDWEASAYFCALALANPEEVEPPAVEPGELKPYG